MAAYHVHHQLEGALLDGCLVVAWAVAFHPREADIVYDGIALTWFIGSDGFPSTDPIQRLGAVET
jgi:hypothetical protein